MTSWTLITRQSAPLVGAIAALGIVLIAINVWWTRNR